MFRLADERFVTQENIIDMQLLTIQLMSDHIYIKTEKTF